MAINRVCISGNLTSDCEKRKAGDTPIANFSVAVNEYRKTKDGGENYPNFFECSLFGKRAVALAKYLVKGVKVCICGRLHYSSWVKDDVKHSKVSIIVDDIEFMSPKTDSGADDKQTSDTANPWADVENDMHF